MLRHYCKIILLSTLTIFFSVSAHAQFFSKTNKLLPEDQAFAVTATVDSSGIVHVSWSIADDYYMYRDQFQVESQTPGLSIGEIVFPTGVVEDDPDFGEVVVYFYNVELLARLSSSNPEQGGQLDLLLKGQGCNKPIGVCYPPLERTITVDFSAENLNQAKQLPIAAVSQAPPNKSLISYIISAFIAGILLSFTPCVLPMIPILAGVIAGQHSPSKWRSGWLAICYVAGTVVTYIAAGALAGATGAQLQAYFQNVWVIAFICILLLLLAASLFGWFKIQLPSAWQSKLSGTNQSSKASSLSSFGLGLISALVVGACVSPILIIALGAAITQGDPVLGAAIMGSMAVGMGSLLILFGFGAGWILPRVGAWMAQIQIVFGFMVLGVAIYLLSSLSYMPSLYLWSALLLCAGFYVWHLPKLSAGESDSPLLASTLRATGAGLLIWGAMALIGGSMQDGDILRPLDSLSFSSDNSKHAELPFVTTTTLAEVRRLMLDAKKSGRPVLIDFYADWCLDCKRMSTTTFKRQNVIQALEGWVLIVVDVTDTSDNSEEVKRFFEVFGPPATLFFQSDGQERSDLRQYGYIKEQDFVNLVEQLKAS